MTRMSRLTCFAFSLVLAPLLGSCYVQPAYVQPQTPPPPPAYAEPPPPPVAAPAAEATFYPTTPPPDPIPEFQPAAPGVGYMWVGGYWDWTGYEWSWNTGYWIPQRAGYIYIGPRFVWEAGQ